MRIVSLPRTARVSRLIAGAAIVAAMGAGPATASGSAWHYPVGVRDTHEPSAMAPPGPGAMPGYHQTYVEDFNRSRLPRGWGLFAGVPTGDPTGLFSPAHVRVSQGILRLRTYRDPIFHNSWVTGGLCQCDKPLTYGAYFVRSRVTAGGANSTELLWPADNAWPPEIDFNENLFHVNLTTETVHWSRHSNFHLININMLRWHTWGVIWTPTHIFDIVDGVIWHEDLQRRTVPHVPMVLDFEQRTSCTYVLPCPSRPSAMLVDWVAEYRLSQ